MIRMADQMFLKENANFFTLSTKFKVYCREPSDAIQTEDWSIMNISVSSQKNCQIKWTLKWQKIGEQRD